MPINNTEKNAYAAGPGRNARETAYRIIRDKIIGCELKPGEAISDKQLAPVPYIVAKHVDEQTDAQGKLSIKVRVKAGDSE